jgi:hypothetical protein
MPKVAMEVPGPAVLEQHAGAICGDKIAGKICNLYYNFPSTSSIVEI